MKARLDISVDKDLLNSAERYVAQKGISISQLIESYFRSLRRPARRQNIIQLMDELPKPQIDTTKNLKQAYYEDQNSKKGI